MEPRVVCQKKGLNWKASCKKDSSTWSSVALRQGPHPTLWEWEGPSPTGLCNWSQPHCCTAARAVWWEPGRSVPRQCLGGLTTLRQSRAKPIPHYRHQGELPSILFRPHGRLGSREAEEGESRCKQEGKGNRVHLTPRPASYWQKRFALPFQLSRGWGYRQWPCHR